MTGKRKKETPLKDRRPERLLVTAVAELVARSGLDQLDIRTIAGTAGTSANRIYEHFGTRDELIAATFNDAWAFLESFILTRLAMIEQHRGVEEMAAALVRAVFDAHEADPARIDALILLSYTTLGMDVRAAMRKTPAFARYQMLAARLIALLVEQGVPERVAKEVEVILFGGVTRAILTLSPAYVGKSEAVRESDPESVVRAICWMIRGVLKGAEDDALPDS